MHDTYWNAKKIGSASDWWLTARWVLPIHRPYDILNFRSSAHVLNWYTSPPTPNCNVEKLFYFSLSRLCAFPTLTFGVRGENLEGHLKLSMSYGWRITREQMCLGTFAVAGREKPIIFLSVYDTVSPRVIFEQPAHGLLSIVWHYCLEHASVALVRLGNLLGLVQTSASSFFCTACALFWETGYLCLVRDVARCAIIIWILRDP